MATMGNRGGGTWRSEIDNHDLVVVQNLRANGNRNNRVEPHRARAVRTLAAMAVLGLQVRVVADVGEVTERRIGNENDAATIAAIATRRTATRHKFLTSKRDSPIAASARRGVDRRPVGEHGLRPADYPSAGATEMMRLPRR